MRCVTCPISPEVIDLYLCQVSKKSDRTILTYFAELLLLDCCVGEREMSEIMSD
jgi:hypothetical protein